MLLLWFCPLPVSVKLNAPSASVFPLSAFVASSVMLPFASYLFEKLIVAISVWFASAIALPSLSTTFLMTFVGASFDASSGSTTTVTATSYSLLS